MESNITRFEESPVSYETVDKDTKNYYINKGNCYENLENLQNAAIVKISCGDFTKDFYVNLVNNKILLRVLRIENIGCSYVCTDGYLYSYDSQKKIMVLKLSYHIPVNWHDIYQQLQIS